MGASTGIRQLIGRLFGRNGSSPDGPFSGLSEEVVTTDAALINDETLAALEEAIGYSIQDRRYFAQALTHRSYLQVADIESLHSNERLEFLGDSILNMLIGEFLFRHYTDVQEGELTKLRSRLVNGKALIVAAHEVRLEEFVLLNTSAEQALQKGNRSILADAFEAIIAAIYLDSGMSLESVKSFLTRTLLKPETFQEILNNDENYKSILLELAQGQGLDAPRYEVVAEEGPDHERIFTVQVYVNGVALGQGEGRSKKKAEQEAAGKAIERMMSLPADGTAAPNDATSDRPDGATPDVNGNV